MYHLNGMVSETAIYSDSITTSTLPPGVFKESNAEGK
jgi:hypothetical protein